MNKMKTKWMLIIVAMMLLVLTLIYLVNGHIFEPITLAIMSYTCAVYADIVGGGNDYLDWKKEKEKHGNS